jgi:hypothetical protein
MVRKFCQEVLAANSLITLDSDWIGWIAKEVAEMGKCTFPSPNINGNILKGVDLVAYELMASAVNYAYWYGHPELRPGGANAFGMYRLLSDSYSSDWARTCDRFSRAMIKQGYPFADRRAAHLAELAPLLQDLADQVHGCQSASDAIEVIVENVPGFAGDVFRKRAFLCVMQLHRQDGRWADSIGAVPIPADYQVPKMLRYLQAFHYSPDLARLVDTYKLIASGSLEECAIRAASIVACDRIGQLSGRTTSDVDYFLWTRRKEVKGPFHLTITTDY